VTDNFAYEVTENDLFGIVDLNTGVFTPVGSTGLRLVGLGSYGGIIYGGVDGESTLYSVNTSTGALTTIGTGNIVYGGFGSTTSGLYAFGANGDLYSINPANGAATDIGPTGLSFGGTAMGMSSGSSTLYLTQNNLLYSLNTTNGSATLIGTTNEGESGFGALVSDGGILYGGAYGASTPDIYTIDPQTGTTTFVTASPSTPSAPGVAGFGGLAPMTSSGGFTFTDNFSPPSTLWSNSSGNWTSSGGKYYAQSPSNNPDTYSGLPFDLPNDLMLTVTINNLRDEGIWLDSDGTINNAVLLVLGGNAQRGNWAYWHIDQNGVQSQPLDINYNAFTPDLAYTITVIVQGNTYKAYVDPDGVYDNNSVLLTTLVSDVYSHGKVGLYDFWPATSFSNFSVTTIAPSVTLISATTDNGATDLNAGHLVTITLTLSEVVKVTGTPTLQLNDNEVATYQNGTGTNSLTFTYKIASGDNIADLQVTGLNLPNGATIQDGAGTALTGSVAQDLALQIDTTAPAVTESLVNDTGSSSTDKITSNDALTGSGDPNAAVHFTVDGKSIAATATADSNGMWTFTPPSLADGQHTVVASETDAAGNTGTASLTFTLDTTAPVPEITSEVLSKSGAVTLTGSTGEANDTIAVYDSATLLGTTTTASNGIWKLTIGSVSNVVHDYTATATDVAGNIGPSSNEAILGSTNADTLVGTSANDIIIGNGGNDTITGGLGADTLTGGSGKVTFVYNSSSDSTPGIHDTISDFNANRDKIDFTNIAGINANNGIATFEGKLTGAGNLTLNAHSVAYIEVNGNTEVLVNTTSTAEIVTSTNVSAANMEIVLVGIHLGLKSADFHHF
jgi:hypothetical protein